MSFATPFQRVGNFLAPKVKKFKDAISRKKSAKVCDQCEAARSKSEKLSQASLFEITSLTSENQQLRNRVEIRDKQLSHLRGLLMQQSVEDSKQIATRVKGWALVRQRTAGFRRIMGTNQSKLQLLPEYYAYAFRAHGGHTRADLTGAESISSAADSKLAHDVVGASLLKRISLRSLLMLKTHLRTCPRRWMTEFIQTGGFNSMIEMLRRFDNEVQRPCFGDVGMMIASVLCIKSVLANKEAIAALVTAMNNRAIRALVSTLTAPNTLLKIVALELVTACSLYSPAGYANMMEAFNFLELDTGEERRFYTLVQSLQLPHLLYQQRVMSLLNVLSSAPNELAARSSVREELNACGLLEILDLLRDTGDARLKSHVDAFVAEMQDDGDEATYLRFNGVDLLDANSILSAIVENVADTPLATQLSSIMKHLLLIPNDELLGGKMWHMVERSVRRHVTFAKDDSADVETSARQLQEALSSKQLLEQSSATISKLEKTILRLQQDAVDARRGAPGQQQMATAAAAPVPTSASAQPVTPARRAGPPAPGVAANAAPDVFNSSIAELAAAAMATAATRTPNTAAAKRGGPPPPAPPPTAGSNAPTTPGAARRGPAPPPPDMLDLTPAAAKTPARKRTGPPLKKLNWTRLAAHKVAGTVWEKLDTSNAASLLSEKDIELLFAAQPAKQPAPASLNMSLMTPMSSGAAGAEKENPPSSLKKIATRVTMNVLDFKRVHTSSILLSQFRIPTAELIKQITEMSETFFSADDLVTLMKLAPTDDETMLLREFSGDVSELSNAEQTMYKMMQIPRLHSRLKSIAFKREFGLRQAEIQSNIGDITAACNEMRSCAPLLRLLELVLELGNILNANASMTGSAPGFKMSSLLRLQDTKASNASRTTLLHYLATVVDSRMPDLALFASGLSHVPAAARVFMPAIDGAMNELRSGLQAIANEVRKCETMQDQDCFGSIMGQFERDARPQLDALEAQVQAAQKLFSSTVEWFGEESKDCPPHEFFAIVVRFQTDFEKARADNSFQEERNKRMALRKMSQQVAAAGKMPATPCTPSTAKTNSVHDIRAALLDGNVFRAKLRGTLAVSPDVFSPSPKRMGGSPLVRLSPMRPLLV